MGWLGLDKVWKGVKNTAKDIFDPNHDDRDKSRHAANAAVHTWDDLGKTPTALDLGVGPMALHGQDAGANYTGQPTTGALANTQAQMQAAGMGQSAGAGVKDKTGHDLSYFRQLAANGGHDAVSDAATAAARGNAEQAGRAQREAGAQNLAARGMGGGGMAALNELGAARGVASDTNAAAMQGAASAQQRRDSAEQSAAGIAENQNAFGLSRAGMQDQAKQYMGNWMADFGKTGAAASQDASNSNVGRTNEAKDADINTVNAATYQHAGAKQQAYQDLLAKTQGKSNAELGKAGAIGSLDTPGVFDYADKISSTAKNIGKAAG